jgi:hypothetical protein
MKARSKESVARHGGLCRTVLLIKPKPIATKVQGEGPSLDITLFPVADTMNIAPSEEFNMRFA